jgi:adenine-specific DNA-methyltransferase
MKRLAEEDRIWWGKDGDSSFPLEKKFLKEAKEGVVQRTWWTYQYAGSTRNASAELKEIFDGRKVFETPKPIQLIKRIIELFDDDDMLVLDAFAGSGTTGHAVLKKNAEDNGRRRFVLVEMESNIASDVTAVRLRRAIEGFEAAGGQPFTLLEKKLTVSGLRRGQELVEEFQREAEARSEDFGEIDLVVEDSSLKLTGWGYKRAGHTVGLGSGFRYCTLGKPLFDEFGGINEQVSFPDLAAHIFFAETGSPLPAKADGSTSLLGFHSKRAIHLLYAPELQGFPNENVGNVLTPSILDALPRPPEVESHVVYAEGCIVSKERLRAAAVVFRQIPYQIGA